MKNQETAIQERIRFALARTGRVILWRNTRGYDERARARYGLGSGAADLVGLLNGGVNAGRFFSLEVKTPGGYMTEAQEAWARAVNGAGGFCTVVTSEHEAIRALYTAHDEEIPSQVATIPAPDMGEEEENDL